MEFLLEGSGYPDDGNTALGVSLQVGREPIAISIALLLSLTRRVLSLHCCGLRGDRGERVMEERLWFEVEVRGCYIFQQRRKRGQSSRTKKNSGYYLFAF